MFPKDRRIPASATLTSLVGERVVVFDYCISLIVITLRRTSRPFVLRPGQWAFPRGLPYTLLSLLLGWWGLPWGVVCTIVAVATNCAGGRELRIEAGQEFA